MSDIDDKLSTTWRSASREEPPAALDAALRAAARRAVGAGPVRTRHMHTWPLAAAAVVAVLAVGILQLTPPQEVTPGIVGDSAPRQAQAPSLRLASSSVPPGETAAPAPGDEPGDNSSRAAPSAPMRDRADVPEQVARGPSASPAPAPDRLTAKPNVASATDSAKLRARADAEQSTESKLAAESDAREVAAAPAARAEPFPAAGVGASLAESSADRAPAGTVAAAPASPPPPPAAARELAKREVAAANAMPTEESQERARPSMARIASAPEQMKDAAIKPPEEWIKLIRRLKSEGRNDEAAKELAAFRTAYGERADALLPADLRAARP
jgi:hypothetical protein